jgi:hypothetical protein
VLAARQPPSEPVWRKPTTRSLYSQLGAQANFGRVGSTTAGTAVGATTGAVVGVAWAQAAKTIVAMMKTKTNFLSFNIFLTPILFLLLSVKRDHHELLCK